MDGLGRLFNVVGPDADGIEIDMTDAEAVTFVCVGDDTFTVQESESNTGTNAQDLDVVDHFYTADADGGSSWTRVNQTADAAVDPGAVGITVFTVSAASMSDGFTHLEVNVTSTTGEVVAILHDLNVQRDPTNLAALAA
jgi:hypothetical protein